MIEYVGICEKMRYGGVNVLNIVMKFPKHELFSEISESSLEWSKTVLFDKVCREYENDTDPKKKFKFGYEYKYSCVICFCGDGLISAKTDVKLKDRRTKKNVAENTYGIVIRESDGAVLPIEAIADKKSAKKYRQRRGESFYIDETGRVFVFDNGKEDLLCDGGVEICDFEGKKC